MKNAIVNRYLDIYNKNNILKISEQRLFGTIFHYFTCSGVGI